jgi:hypothetical protein
MNSFIDLGSEFLVDSSAIDDPYIRLFAIAVGQNMVPGSPWMAIDKSFAQACDLRGNPLEGAARGGETESCEVEEVFCFARLARRRFSSDPTAIGNAPFPASR